MRMRFTGEGIPLKFVDGTRQRTCDAGNPEFRMERALLGVEDDEEEGGMTAALLFFRLLGVPSRETRVLGGVSGQ